MSAQRAVSVPLENAQRAQLTPVSAALTPPVSVVVPCYDEVEGIPPLLKRLETMVPLGWEVVFVDDGSRDATFATLLSAARTRPWMRVVRHGTNLGLGAAMRTGFAYARAPIVCTMDSDCTYLPERLPELVRLVEQGADIATASPWHPDGVATQAGWFRSALSRTVSRLYKRLIGQDVHTFTCLYRAYRREVVERTQFRATGFAAVAELMLRGLLSGCRVRELPMELEARQFGESKLRIGDAILSHVALLFLTAAVLSGRWARGLIGLP
jgi:dolichol-phosphate mannosyltransferase